jgi:hypothetical protein
MIEKARADNMKIEQAVVQEIQKIDDVLKKQHCSKTTIAALQLARAFYVEMTKYPGLVRNNELKSVSVNIVFEIVREMEDMKI